MKRGAETTKSGSKNLHVVVYITLIIGLCVGCSQREAASVSAVLDAGSGFFDSGVSVVLPAAPDRLEVRWVAETVDGGESRFRSLRIQLDSRDALSDFRVRVFDGTDRVVASDDRLAPGADGGVEYVISFAGMGLAPGDYVLRVEGQTADNPVGALGTVFDSFEAPFVATGAPDIERAVDKKSRPKRKKKP